MPLPEVIRAYRLTFAGLWDALVERAAATAGGSGDGVLLWTATRLWRLSDEHAIALTEGYRAATAEILQAQQRRRTALVEALLTGQHGPRATPWEAARLLDLPLDASHVVVAAESRTLADECLAGIERSLAARGMTSAWRLTPALQLGIVSLETKDLEPVLDVLRSSAVSRTGVSPVFRSSSEAPRALHLALVVCWWCWGACRSAPPRCARSVRTPWRPCWPAIPTRRIDWSARCSANWTN